MKITYVIFLSALTVFSIQNAHSENRLFPTDILEKGRVDVNARVQYQTKTFNTNYLGVSGRRSAEFTGEEITARYGLAKDWQIGTSVSYASQNDISDQWSSGERLKQSYNGKQNPSFWAQYGIITDPSSRFSLRSGLLVSPNTTGTTNTYSGNLSAGWKSNETLKLYATFNINRQSNPDYQDSVNFGIGAYKILKNGVTIVPSIGLTQYNSSNTLTSRSDYNIGISAIIPVLTNTYLLPSISNFGSSSTDRKDSPLRFDSTHNGLSAQIGIYHLF